MAIENPTAEEWRVVPNSDGNYEASTLGRVRSTNRTISAQRRGRLVGVKRSGVILRPIRNKGGGYFAVRIHCDGVRRLEFVHHIVLRTFVRDRVAGEECDHINFNRSDNRVSNLRWVAHAENVRHSCDHGRQGLQASATYSMLGESSIREIRRLSALGWKNVEIASRFCVSQGCVSGIVLRKRWAHVA